MDKYRVRGFYTQGSEKPYGKDIIDKWTGEFVYRLCFDHDPSWDEIVAEVKRLDALDSEPAVKCEYEEATKEARQNETQFYAEENDSWWCPLANDYCLDEHCEDCDIAKAFEASLP